MKELLLLELRKQRLAFIGLAGAFVATLSIAAVVGVLTSITARDGAEAAVLFWTLFGIPFSGVLLSSSAGAGMWRQPSCLAETILPVSPAKRAAGGLLAALIYFLVLAIIIFLFYTFMNPRLFQLAPLADSPWVLGASAALLVGAMLGLQLACFVCALASGHGLLGGMLGIAISVGTAAFMLFGFGLELAFYLNGEGPFPWFGSMIAPFSLIGCLLALKICATWVEREIQSGWRRRAVVGGMLCAGFFPGILAVLHVGIILADKPRLVLAVSDTGDVGHLAYPWNPAQQLAHAMLPAVRAAEAGTVLTQTFTGEICLLHADGRRRVLKDGTYNPFRWIYSPRISGVQDVAWDETGRLWVQFDPRGGGKVPHCAIWAASEGEPLRQVYARNILCGDLGWFAYMGRELVLLKFTGTCDVWRIQKNERQHLKLKGSWRDWRDAGLPQAWEKEGLAIRNSSAGFRQSDWIAATRVGGRNLFLHEGESKGCAFLSVRERGGPERRHWCAPSIMGDFRNSAEHRLALLPDGSYWGPRDRYSLHVLTAEGEFLRPLFLWPGLRELPKELPRDSEWPEGRPTVLRRNGDSLWLIAEHRFLVQVNMRTGQFERWWRLPDSSNCGYFRWRTTEGGFFLDTGLRIYFVDWEGRARKLV